MPRSAVATDNFNRASLDSNWAQVNPVAGNVLINGSVQFAGQYSISSAGSKAAAKWVGAGSFTNDQYSSIILNDLIGNSADYAAGASARVGTGTNGTRTYYEAVVLGGSGVPPYVTELALQNGATRTVLNTASVTWAVGDALSIECEGTTIRLCKNGTPLGGGFTVTDTTLTSGVPGIVAGGALTFGDNWEGGNLTAGTAPTITTHPSAQSVTAGATATFSAAASGSPTPTFQWQRSTDGGTTWNNISGAVAASYTTPATTVSGGSANNGDRYRAVATNTSGSATSNAALLTVSAGAVAPTITTQPSSQTVTAGASATMSVTATGTAPLSYQWRKGGVNISGATGSSYIIGTTVTGDSGSYDVVVSNTAGSVTSSAAVLTVNASGGGSVGRLLFNGVNDVFANNTGPMAGLLASKSMVVHVHHATTGALVHTATVTTDSAGRIAPISGGTMALSTLYRMDFKFSTGEYGVIYRTTEAT